LRRLETNARIAAPSSAREPGAERFGVDKIVHHCEICQRVADGEVVVSVE
jgi:hypothetical protein